MKVTIDPRARISYASYYITGLWEAFGKRNVKFSIKPFTDLRQTNPQESFDQYFAFVLQDEKNKTERIVIDYRDKSNINISAVEWADLYGKVNFNPEDADFMILQSELKHSIIPVGTNFGVRIWSAFDTTKYLLLNYLKSIQYLPINFRIFLSGYSWQLKRETLDFYQTAQSGADYVFHASGFYINQEHGELVNNLRAMFIRTCKSNSKCTFEGGLLNKSINIKTYSQKNIIRPMDICKT
ncbi:hypothetical protein [Microbacter margulisiae]|uniref:Uncharacterized protein n=1 Tax=Microbacter margulisiae TaxID=1350067 RepID=A0A7W5DN46_9PORP|nr:hypothetical protein [Microbacter margulisiae]MBB3185982.1 hypothetical protein [Microbacter margulisiae]